MSASAALRVCGLVRLSLSWTVCYASVQDMKWSPYSEIHLSGILTSAEQSVDLRHATDRSQKEGAEIWNQN